MIKIFLFCDTHKHFQTAIGEYEKRLGKSVQVIPLKPSKKADEKALVLEESLILKERLQAEKWYKIYLDIWGKMISSEALAVLFEQKKQHYSDFVFVIGGAYGVDLEILGNSFDLRLSFSPMTFPHSMAFLMLLEQIYRTQMITKGSGYHHGNIW